MTLFLDAGCVTALVRQTGFDEFIAGLEGYIADDYRRWPDFTKAPRYAHHAERGVLELMPIGDKDLFSFKYVNGHPGNCLQGLPTVVAFGMLADVATGLPLMLSEMTLTTALRTAATSALAARYMARKNSQSMAVIGCGAQCEFQILAFNALLDIHNFYLFDIDAGAMRKVQQNLFGHNGLRISLASSVWEAVKGADIVTTATADKTNAVILTPELIAPGTHLNAIGGDCPGKTELDPAILENARIVVEYEPQTRIEGEIQQLAGDAPVTELWKILTGAEKGRYADTEITLFDSVGFALEDFSALRYLYDLAKAHAIGGQIDLLPALQDPKNLFAFLNA